MSSFERPTLLISRCIEFDHCRWNGLIIASDVVKLLKPHVDFVHLCPEVGIGLGIPREPVRVVQTEQGLGLYQPATDTYWTQEMLQFAQTALDQLPPIDGAILKSRSPSCGLKEVKVYPVNPQSMPRKDGMGFFAQAVTEHFPDLALEDEGRLSNFQIREQFLTYVFASAAFRRCRALGSIGALVEFHARNKLLLMAYRETSMRAMGQIVANHERQEATKVFTDYESHLRQALSRPARRPASINVLMHALGYFKEGLLGAEKSFFLETLEDYRAGRVPLSVPVSLIRAWIVRFGQDYLRDQSFFSAYPEELVAITDSGKGRDLS